MRLARWRLSDSSFDSPGPRVPMPPPSLESCLPLPTRRGAVYLSCASSTCSLPSAVAACCAKISSMSIERSMTLTSPSSSSTFLICDGVISQSKTHSSAPHSSQTVLSSASFPLPMTVLTSGFSRACTRRAATSAPAVSASLSSSSSETSHSPSFISDVSTPTSTARTLLSSLLMSFNIMSFPLPFLWNEKRRKKRNGASRHISAHNLPPLS